MKEENAREGAGYPEVIFWNSDAVPFTVINPRDLLLEPLWKQLGVENNPLLKSIAVSDRDEIVRRQRILKYLREHPKMLSFIRRINLDDLAFPDTEQRFLDHFRERNNRFWSAVRKFVQFVERSSDAPAEFVSLAKYLRDVMGWLRDEERSLADDVASEIQRSASIRGRIEIALPNPKDKDVSAIVRDSMVYGHQLYSYSLSNKLREFAIGQTDGFFGLVRLVAESVLEWFKRSTMYSPLMINRLPEQLSKDLSEFFSSAACFARNDMMSKDDSPRSGPESLQEIEEINLALDFEYGWDGLNIRIVKVIGKPKPSKKASATADEWKAERFPGYGPLARMRMTRHAESVNELLRLGMIEQTVQVYVEKVDTRQPGFKNDWLTIESKYTDSAYKWTTLTAVLGLPEHEGRYKRSCECRNGFRGHLQLLKYMQQLTDATSKYAKANGLPFIFPEVLADGHHQVSFDGLYPIHLIGREIRKDGKVIGNIEAPDLVSLQAFPPINGQMVGLTGKNAGGKTVVLESLSQMLYLAHAGLPVFAEGFKFNVKDAMGLLFLERGDGSVAELMVEKITGIVQQLNVLGKEKVILLFDEVGSATAEGGVGADGKAFGGYGMGERLLQKVSRHGCSVIFSTQITDLATMAEQNLRAINFQLTEDHRIEPGIGTSDIEYLMRKSGLETLLEQ